MSEYDQAFNPNILIGHCDLISRFSDFALYLDTQLVYLYPRHLCRRVYSFRFSVRPFVCSLVRWFVSSVKMSKFWLKFLCWCISHELYIRNHSYMDYRYPIGLALFL